MRYSRKQPRRCVAILPLLAAGLATLGPTPQPVRAQNALGDGTRLDRSLRVGSGGKNVGGRDFAAELRFRNAIITGNAPGGLSFRGDVGYKGPNEFFGNLPSDELFAFRRDSVYSGLAGMGLRGTDALQYQFAMTTGNAPPPGLTGTGVIRRSVVASSGAEIPAPPAEPRVTGDPGLTRPSLSQELADESGLTLWTLRSPSAYIAARGLSPTLLGVTTTPDGKQYGVAASTLRGIAPVALPPAEPEAPATEAIPPARLDLPATARPSDTIVKPETPETADRPLTPYEQLTRELEQISERMKPEEPAGAPTVEPGAGPTAPAPGGPGAGLPRPLWETWLDELRAQLEGRPTAREAEEAEEAAADVPFRSSTLELLRTTTSQVRTFVGDGVDAYSKHLQLGQQHLREGRYFDAEERFTAALSLRPGDTMAAIARIHAQLGSSMFLSASINLRGLLLRHPEVAAMRFEPDLLPRAERLEALTAQLATLTGGTEGSRRESALLLAYVARQRGDRATIGQALDVIRPPERAPGTKDDELDRLAMLLREVWLTDAESGPVKSDR